MLWLLRLLWLSFPLTGIMRSCTVGVSPWQLLILFQPKTVSESWTPGPDPRDKNMEKVQVTAIGKDVI